jgi:hypothetical protein
MTVENLLTIIVMCTIQYSDQYELLNYSKFGSVVDGVVFACDSIDRPSNALSKKSSVVDDVRRVIGHKSSKGGPNASNSESPQPPVSFLNAATLRKNCNSRVSNVMLCIVFRSHASVVMKAAM